MRRIKNVYNSVKAAIKTIVRNLWICSAFFLVAGCTGAQMESSRMQKVAAETYTTGRDCLQRIIDNPEYENIKTKTYLGFDNQFPLQMLTDTSRPTKEDIKLLYKIYGETQECRKMMLDGAAKTHPLVLLTLVETFSESDKLWAEATSGKLAWGIFNQRRKDISTQAQTNMVQANMQIASQLQNQHQFEIEQRRRAAAAMQQWAYQQEALNNQRQLIDAMSRPRMTTINCNYYGNTATCNSF